MYLYKILLICLVSTKIGSINGLYSDPFWSYNSIGYNAGLPALSELIGSGVANIQDRRHRHFSHEHDRHKRSVIFASSNSNYNGYAQAYPRYTQTNHQRRLFKRSIVPVSYYSPIQFSRQRRQKFPSPIFHHFFQSTTPYQSWYDANKKTDFPRKQTILTKRNPSSQKAKIVNTKIEYFTKRYDSLTSLIKTIKAEAQTTHATHMNANLERLLGAQKDLADKILSFKIFLDRELEEARGRKFRKGKIQGRNQKNGKELLLRDQILGNRYVW